MTSWLTHKQSNLPRKSQGRLLGRKGIAAGVLWVCRSLPIERALLVKVLSHGKAWSLKKRKIWCSLGMGKAVCGSNLGRIGLVLSLVPRSVSQLKA